MIDFLPISTRQTTSVTFLHSKSFCKGSTLKQNSNSFFVVFFFFFFFSEKTDVPHATNFQFFYCCDLEN